MVHRTARVLSSRTVDYGQGKFLHRINTAITNDGDERKSSVPGEPPAPSPLASLAIQQRHVAQVVALTIEAVCN